MGGFLAELKRRNIYRVASAYLVVAWLLLQLVANVTPIIGAPQWVAQSCLLLLALGFPIAAFLAWTRELPASGPAAPMRANATDWALLAALGVVIALVSYQQFAPQASREPNIATARSASLNPATAISLAVLPFANLSSDPEQEFFSDGMTEEVTAALAKVPDLRVVARTSAFEFKGKNISIKTMGEELGATHLIEGSVRKAGTRLRITAQLIKADDGTHIWTEEYNRELTDVFQIQEDIARAITASLHMSLGLKPGENLVNNRDIDPETYQQFLRARALAPARGLRQMMETAALLEGVVARYPNYAPAWALLAGVYNVIPNSTPQRSGSAVEYRRVVDEYFSKSDAALKRAIQLDPTMPEPYGTLATRARTTGKPLEAEALYARAPGLGQAWATNYGRSLLVELVGRVKEALEMRQQLQTDEPFVPLYKNALVSALWVNGQNEEALALAKTLPAGDSANGAPLPIAIISASMGRYGEAADALAPLSSRPEVDAAIRLLRTAPSKTDKPQDFPALGVQLAWVYFYVGGESRVLDNYESSLEGGRLPGMQMGWLWHPLYAPVRKTERFKAFARKAGFVEYWRAKGWPEFCHPTTGDDFACE